ncbi:MAG: hypothetical protein LQ343_005082 [Gyalolechia ehrenbergii]|nr:MAG: hypothetical protein LQ343_005082 [Gyalolechia ehrenbergii]
MARSAVASLVDEGKLAWDLPIREYLPLFFHRADDIGQKTILKDLLSHRTGLPNADYLFGQQYGEFLMPRSEIVRLTTFLEPVRPFRKKFLCSQWNYGLSTEVIETVTGISLGMYIQDHVLKPLGMCRTTLGKAEGENVAIGYALANYGSPHQIDFPNMNDGVGLAGGFAGKSTVYDLLLFYQGLLEAKRDQADTQRSRTVGLPFAQVNAIFSPHIALGSDPDKLAYCLGLYRTRLSGALSVGSINGLLLGPKELPVIGKSSPGLEIYHHTGNIPGSLASTFLVPSTRSAVVVWTNALPFMDVTDLIGQMSILALMGEDPEIDFVALAKRARANGLIAYSTLTAAVKKARFPNFLDSP